MDGLGLATAQLDPLTTIDDYDDFLTGGLISGSIGRLGWSFGAATASQVAATGSARGILRRTTSTTPGTIAYTRLLASTGAHPFFADDAFDMTWVFRLNTNDADTKVRIGLSSDFTSDTPTSGIYVEKLGADTQWFGVCRATTENRTAALATVDTSFHKVRIRRIGATVGFTFDSGAEVIQSSTVPGSVGVHPGTQITTAAAADKSLDHDYYRLIITGLSR